jgi:hypothetical protein
MLTRGGAPVTGLQVLLFETLWNDFWPAIA